MTNLAEKLQNQERSDCFNLVIRPLSSANWKVAWHQDLSIAVKEKCEIPG